jgi:hypothetical protein
MARKKKPKRYLRLSYKNLTIRVLLDKVLVFRLLRGLHSRFWGIAGISMMSIGFAVCFAIRPDLRDVSTAFSDFGNDVRTAPYFAGSVFVGAYGMWRWRNYLARTWKRAMPVTGLLTLTILGLYIVALMPISWNNQVHMGGMILAGISMLATVVADGLLSKPSARNSRIHWRAVRVTSFSAIVVGGWLTFGSSELADWYDVALLGESLMLLGYLLWVGVKTYQGEGSRSQLSRSLRRIVLID